VVTVIQCCQETGHTHGYMNAWSLPVGCSISSGRLGLFILVNPNIEPMKNPCKAFEEIRIILSMNGVSGCEGPPVPPFLLLPFIV
jgi:hypothetical protein